MGNIKEYLDKLTIKEKCSLLSGANFWQSRSVGHIGLLRLTFSDGPCGLRRSSEGDSHLGLCKSIPSTCFPAASALSASFNEELLEQVGQAIGEEALALDVDVLLGPGVNIKRNPLCGRNFEYFSEDPYLTGKLAAAYVKGVQSTGIAACPKHFAVNSQETLRMVSNSVVDKRTLREIYLKAFEIIVKEAKPMSIMTSYNRINGTYANEHRMLLDDILRKEWGFDGFVVSDWGGANDSVDGVKAGANLVMPSDFGQDAEDLLLAVEKGELTEKEIDVRVEEFLRCAFKLRGILKRKPDIDFDAHHALARRAARECIVLLKNEGDILPLAKGTKAAVIGEFSTRPTIQGGGSSQVNPTKVDTAKELIAESGLDMVAHARGYFENEPLNLVEAELAVRAAKKAEVVLYYMGLPDFMESEAVDRRDMKLPAAQVELLHKIYAVNKNIVVVLSSGSPVEMEWEGECRAILQTGLAGQAVAGASFDVITGKYNPSGKLTETYPVKYEDVPFGDSYPATEIDTLYKEGLFVGYRYYESAKVNVRYPFGYGLSYSDFEYSDLEITSEGVYFTVKNTGKYEGIDVPQLYVGKKNSIIYRPTLALSGYIRVKLKPNCALRVYIPFSENTFEYYNTELDRYMTESGVYNIMIGKNCHDIVLRGELSMAGKEHELPKTQCLEAYRSCDLKSVTNEDFWKLIGQKPELLAEKNYIDENTPICMLYKAKNPIARFIYKRLKNKVARSYKRGRADLNLLFVYNMPLRGIRRMAGGLVSDKMVGGMVDFCNGHGFRGFFTIVSGYFEARRVVKRARELE